MTFDDESQTEEVDVPRLRSFVRAQILVKQQKRDGRIDEKRDIRMQMDRMTYYR